MSNKGEILVTGGAGFIGSHTVVELVNAGYSPIIVDNFSNTTDLILDGLEQIVGSKTPIYRIDVRDQEAMELVFRNHNIQGIIHFAAFKAVGESVKDPLSYYDNNVNGLIAILHLALKHKVKNFVFSSSCTIYGEQKEDAIVTENSEKGEAFSPYGASKQMDERILKDLAQSMADMKILCLRYFNPIGAHQTGLIGELPIGTPNNLIPYIMQTAIGKRDQLTVFGNDYPTHDGTCIRDYVHVSDVSNAHVVGLNWLKDQEKTLCEFVNIGTGFGQSVLEIIHTFEKVSGTKLNWTYGARRAGDITKITADVSRAKQMLGWVANKTVEDALTDAWKWEQNLKNEN